MLKLTLLWERRGECPGASHVLAVHDEIVVEADADQADATTVWLKAAMVPLIDPVPVEVEAKIARTWGGDWAMTPTHHSTPAHRERSSTRQA